MTLERPRPHFLPAARELDDVELLRMGVLTPQTGFLGPEQDVTLHVPPAVADDALTCGELTVVDGEGVPLAVVMVDQTYPADDGMVGITGAVRALAGTVRRAFEEHYLSPSATRTVMPADTVTVPVTAALTSRDIQDIAAARRDRPLLLLVMTGAGTPQGLSVDGLLRATLTAARHLPDSTVVAVPVAARPDPSARTAFQRRAVAAYALGLDVHWPDGEGELTDDVAEVVRFDRPQGHHQGVVVFFTGLSGSGKSTIAQALRHRLVESGERTVSLLDGDRVRHHLSRGLTFSREDRETNIERIGWVAAELAKHGAFTICSPIAPFDATRRWARERVTEAGAAFILVHVSTPLEVCEARDRKGLYAMARRGEVAEFTGITSPYEPPDDAELVIDTTHRTVGAVLDELLAHLVDGGWLSGAVLEHSPVITPAQP